MPSVGKLHASQRASSFTESVIREMTRLANLHEAINLGQGFPDFPAPEEVKEAARRAIADDHNQYPITWGVPAFREAIAAKYGRVYGMDGRPGDARSASPAASTEAMIAAMLGRARSGRRGRGLRAVLRELRARTRSSSGAVAAATSRCARPTGRSTRTSCARAFNDAHARDHRSTRRTTRPARCSRATSCRRSRSCACEHDAIAITDEIYEHITYDGARAHADRDAARAWRERTVTISALSKTYSVTGWRVGWAIAPPALMAGIRAGARLPDGGGRGAAADRRRRGARAARVDYYADARGRVRRAARR